MKTLEVTNIIKHEIVYKIKEKRKYKLKHVSVVLCLFFVLSILYIDNNMLNIVKNINFINNPVNSLYNDDSNVIFTNTDKVLNFVIPVKGSISNTENDGTLTFLVDKSIMVGASESGIIEDVGTTNDNIKYIKIKHTETISSVIENIDMIGVAVGDIVKSGQDIATAKEGSVVVFRLFDNDVQINNLKIIQSKIIWQD